MTPESDDFIVEYLKRKKIPVTRENYLLIDFLGSPPEELGAEQEAELPKRLQRRQRKAK